MISYATEISTHLSKLDSNDKKLVYANTIFSKLVCHAVTLRRVSPSPNMTPNTELWDVSSACAIARALIETYEALAYISINEAQLDKVEFRIFLWELHDLHRRIKMLTLMKSSNPELKNMESKASELSSKVIGHPLFLSCSKVIQKKIKSGNTPAYYLSQIQLNSLYGINHEYHTTTTMALSQYVHTFPMAIHQLMGFKAGDSQSLRLCSLPIQYSMAFLAKAVTNVVSLLPSKADSPTLETKEDLEFWHEIGVKGISNI